MAMLTNLRLSTRIYLQQFLLLAALIGVGTFSIYSASNATDEVYVIETWQTPLYEHFTQITQAQWAEEHYLERVMRFGPDIHRSEYARKQFEQAVEELNSREETIKRLMQESHEMIDEAMASGFTDSLTNLFKATLQNLEAVEKLHGQYKQRMENIIEGFRDPNTDISSLTGEENEVLEKELSQAMEKFSRDGKELFLAPLHEANDFIQRMASTLWVVILLVTAIALGLAIYSGLTLTALRKAMVNIANSIQQVASASSQSSNAIGMVADGSKQQSEAISQAVTAVNQSVSVLGDVSENAENATKLSKDAARTVVDGRSQMQEMVSVVNRIAENSGKINKITDVINNIASQTNMLSLNAAIEAARAGEHGKGFAVVAEQVRKLAENSRNSVQDIVELVNQATQDANAAVSVADRVNDEIGRIESAATETEHMMQGIATSMEQQVATTEELQHNMDTLKSIGDNNANAAEEITQTIIELSRIADETNDEVSKFNI